MLTPPSGWPEPPDCRRFSSAQPSCRWRQRCRNCWSLSLPQPGAAWIWPRATPSDRSAPTRLLPPEVPRRELLAKGLLFFASCAVLLVLCLDGTLTLVEGIILLALFGWFLAENLPGTRKTGADARERIPVSRRDVVKQLLLFGLGAVALVLGSDLLVDSGTFLAQALGISQRLIAITMVAIGTSLPELVTTITALVKRHGSLSIGNILGANIIDLTLILPLCALVSGGALPVSSGTANIDLPICLAVATLAVFPALLRRRFTRWQGFCMLALYLGYLTLSVLYGAG